jgi:dTDP-4-dehydrorhamnose 3,5-epimerase
MELVPLSISGCYEIRPRVFADERGTFVKTFHRDTFVKWGLAGEFAEQFYSTSRRGVLRGLHFQMPPCEQAKLVTCVCGQVLDAAVDLRKDSPTYGQHVMLELDAHKGNAVYLPVGMAHGFYTLSETATVLYNTTTVHSPAQDSGIRWDSAGIAWPTTNPIVSARDSQFTRLDEFRTVFEYRRDG